MPKIKQNDSSNGILVLGDSHARAYGMNPNFFPIFLGAGKYANFIDWSRVDNLLERCEAIHKNLKPDTVVICLGEPDTRYAFGLGWQPWESNYPRDENNYLFLEKCAKRYVYFIKKIEENFEWNTKVQNIVLTQDVLQCNYINFYNSLLRSELGNRFIYFNDKIRSESGTIDKKYSWDRIHANNNITTYIESSLGKSIMKNQLVSNEDMKKYFHVNSKFSNYELQEKNNISLFRKMINIFNR